MRLTPTQLLLEKALGEPLFAYLDKMRADERSWPYIARDIEKRAGAEVSDETLRRWYYTARQPTQASAA